MAGPTLFRPSSITSGLVGYWKLDEASGSRADSSGNGYTLTDNNTVTANAFDYWKTGENSALFNGANSEYLSRTDTNALDFAGTSFTLVCWMRRGTDVNTAALFSKNAASSDGYLFYTPAGDTRLNLYLNSTLYQSGTGVIGASGSRKWQHVACVRDVSAGTVSFYVDGNLVYTTTSAVTLAGNATDFQLGKYGSSAAYFGGDMKDAAAWNVALTPIQIKSLALGVDLSNFAYRPSNVSTAPTHYYKLNELSSGAGAVARVDSALSGGINLTDNNTTPSKEGYIEGSGAFFTTASSEYLSAADSADWDFGMGDYSISLWAKFTAIGAQMCLLEKSYTGNGFLLSVNAAGTALNWRYQGAAVLYTPAYTFKAATWYHIVIRRSGTSWKAFVDGVEIDSQTNSNDISGTAGLVGIGADITDAAFYMGGSMADVAIWKGYALTAAEIKSLACGIPLQQTGIVSYWKLDETSGSRADSIGANTLTDNNTVLSGTGKVSNAADFESANSEYLSIADASQSGLDITTDFSLICWVNPESSGSQFFIDKDQDTLGYGLQKSAGNVPYLNIRNVQQAATTALSNGTWYHLVGIYDQATKRIFVNSAQEGTSASTTDCGNNADPLEIGRLNSASAYYDGLMDEALIAKRWFRDEEIKTIYCKGLCAKELTSEERGSSSSSGNFFLFF